MAGYTSLEQLLQPERRAHKYGAKKQLVDGILFPSKAEARRYLELKLLMQAGEIDELILQPQFVLAPGVVLHGKKKPALRFTADFSYLDKKTGLRVVEDVKGGRATATEAYRMRIHLLKHVHGIEVTEVK